jgi:hypothetical protein
MTLVNAFDAARKRLINFPRDGRPSWRDLIKVHPAADLFPMMPEAELRELGEDIKKSGLTSPIVLYLDPSLPINKHSDPKQYMLLDGRNRLDAMTLVGIEFELTFDKPQKRWVLSTDDDSPFLGHDNPIKVESPNDPYDYVISANIHRRHLTAEQRRDLISKFLQANPEKSDRAIADQMKVDKNVVSRVRQKAEATGAVAPVEKRTGKDGKARKAHKPANAAKRHKSKATTYINGRAVSDEEARAFLQEAIAKEDATEARAITILIEHLGPTALKEFIACLRQCSICVDKLEHAANARAVWDENSSAQPQGNSDDDGLDIPGFLKRDAKAGAA